MAFQEKWSTAIQYMVGAGTEMEARLALDSLKLQDGFLGGRILKPETTSGVWRVQALFQDEPGLSGSSIKFLEGARRVTVPPSLWSSLERNPTSPDRRDEFDPAEDVTEFQRKAAKDFARSLMLRREGSGPGGTVHAVVARIRKWEREAAQGNDRNADDLRFYRAVLKEYRAMKSELVKSRSRRNPTIRVAGGEVDFIDMGDGHYSIVADANHPFLKRVGSMEELRDIAGVQMGKPVHRPKTFVEQPDGSWAERRNPDTYPETFHRYRLQLWRLEDGRWFPAGKHYYIDRNEAVKDGGRMCGAGAGRAYTVAAMKSNALAAYGGSGLTKAAASRLITAGMARRSPGGSAGRSNPHGQRPDGLKTGFAGLKVGDVVEYWTGDDSTAHSKVTGIYPGIVRVKDGSDVPMNRISRTWVSAAYRRIFGAAPERYAPRKGNPGGGRFGPALKTLRAMGVYEPYISTSSDNQSIVIESYPLEARIKAGFDPKTGPVHTYQIVNTRGGETLVHGVVTAIGQDLLRRVGQALIEFHGPAFEEVKVKEAETMQRIRGGKSNPESEAAELYESFHGRPSEETLEIGETIHYHEHLAALGDLKEIKVNCFSGYSGILNFDSETKLCSNEEGTQLYIVGGDQSIDLATLKFKDDEIAKDQVAVGVIEELTYHTAKGFDKFRPTDYYHELGEESGYQPILTYDTRNQLLTIAGGAYKIKPEGIVD